MGAIMPLVHEAGTSLRRMGATCARKNYTLISSFSSLFAIQASNNCSKVL